MNDMTMLLISDFSFKQFFLVTFTFICGPGDPIYCTRSIKLPSFQHIRIANHFLTPQEIKANVKS